MHLILLSNCGSHSVSRVPQVFGYIGISGFKTSCHLSSDISKFSLLLNAMLFISCCQLIYPVVMCKLSFNNALKNLYNSVEVVSQFFFLIFPEVSYLARSQL